MRLIPRFRPKSMDLWLDYSRERFIRDIGAGITVAVVALPLAMAFAIASGLKPEAGIFTAIIAGFLISAFGGSRVQIGGPAGAFIVIVYGIVQQHGVSGLLLATFMSGVMLFLMGCLRMGLLIKFIPVAVIIGFTNGIAVLIGLSQLKDFLGLRVAQMPAEFFAQIRTLWQALPSFNPQALIVALTSLTIIIAWQQIMIQRLRLPKAAGVLPRVRGSLALIPGSIIALIFATIMAKGLHLSVETIGSRFGGIPQGLPSLSLPNFSLHTMQQMLLPAFTLAILGAIESLLCARVADSLIKDRHDSNQELLAQGIANMSVAFCSGMPATGTIARTITNIKNGGSSPISGMVHSLALLLVILIAAPYAQYIPLAALSAILMFVAWNMGEWKAFVRLRRFRLPYRLTLLSVFVLTVVIDVTVAVEVGLLLACLIFIYRISSLSSAETLTDAPEDVLAYQLTGALFFAATKLIEPLEYQQPKALVLDFSGVIYIDSSGAESLENLRENYHERGIPLLLCGLRPQAIDMLTRSGLLDKLGDNAHFPDRHSAYQAIQ